MGAIAKLRPGPAYTLDVFAREVDRIRGQLRATALPLYLELGGLVVRAHENGLKREDIASVLGKSTAHVDKLLRVGRWSPHQCKLAVAACESWSEIDRFGREPRKLPAKKLVTPITRPAPPAPATKPVPPSPADLLKAYVTLSDRISDGAPYCELADIQKRDLALHELSVLYTALGVQTTDRPEDCLKDALARIASLKAPS